ncbi:Phenylacetaldehyde dehydrogenase [wastewater metagenome]|uniref:Phenylacetaldehyde dehydrogenase n=2 Tax=unclassified sequences TaxID=12908 RepID=A0A5B8RA80_9ZZZZ|nr:MULTISPECIES: aldehyde dehydrogenase family protein [Arhodomonas]MCS4505587.1 aldehyde dehydrogenase family protein [Arhodomonas aquaeolei]QEA06109.1 phenylacetaldehyde dehydrogenase [uncultured organism]
MEETARHWIDGAWTPSRDGAEAQSMDPATGRAIGRFADGGDAEAGAAIDSAWQAFFHGEWAASPRRRAQVLLDYADALTQRREPLAELLTRETGRLLRASRGEINGAISELRFYAGLARTVFGRVTEVEPGEFSLLTREPAGVAGIIVPWNAPAILLVRSLAPAMAAGCTSVIKLAPQSSLFQTAFLAPLYEQTDLPAGVVNSLCGTGSAAGERMVASPRVHVISFTGSSAVGKRIMAASADTMKRLNLELGGKAPCVVFDDVDVDAVAPRLAAAATILSGQQCTAADRVLVHESRAAQMREALAEAMTSLVVGPGMDEASQMGPLIDHASRDRVAGVVEAAGRYGEVIVRGGIPDGPLADGAFLTPSLIAVSDLDAPMVQEEFFGPVLNLETFSDESEAVARANATPFGLAASVWTADAARGRRVARGIRSGTVWINDHNKLFAEAETGGFGESGVGRLHGAEAMAEFLETKHIHETVGHVEPAPLPGRER